VHSAPRKRRDTAATTPAPSRADRKERERTSPIINAGAKYIQAMTGLHAGFKADPTSDNDVAGLDDGQLGDRQAMRARRALHDLRLRAKRTKNPSAVEVSSMARVMGAPLAQFFQTQNRDRHNLQTLLRG
jgi:hypothetical protein